MWWIKVPTFRPVPMGISSSPAPDDVPGVYSVPVGASGAVRFAEHLSHASAELVELVNRYLLLNKVPLPFVKDWVDDLFHG